MKSGKYNCFSIKILNILAENITLQSVNSNFSFLFEEVNICSR